MRWEIEYTDEFGRWFRGLPAGVGTLRLLFAFDPRRVAILLLGGDKRGSWSDWYKRAIPLADRIYDRHLDDLRKERLS